MTSFRFLRSLRCVRCVGWKPRLSLRVERPGVTAGRAVRRRSCDTTDTSTSLSQRRRGRRRGNAGRGSDRSPDRTADTILGARVHLAAAQSGSRTDDRTPTTVIHITILCTVIHITDLRRFTLIISWPPSS